MKAVQVIAVTGGKGGVGKTNIAINLAVALAQSGQRVALLDADFSLANVDVLLGLHAEKNIEHVLRGECALKDIILTGPAGVRIIPASSGVRKLTRLTSLEQAGLIRAFSDLGGQIDVLVVDTAAGISDSVLTFVNAAREVLLVLCNEPSSFTDAYALIKLLNRDFARRRFRVITNMLANDAEGKELFRRLLAVCEQFLDVTLMYAGGVPLDPALARAVKKQVPVILNEPGAPASMAIRRLAAEIESWPLSGKASGGVEFFVESLFSADRLVLSQFAAQRRQLDG